MNLKEAIKMREQGRPEESLKILRSLLVNDPNNPNLNYHAAWACDSMGRESVAAQYYEAAIKNGLSGENLKGALLGLGSTYRCLGEYEKSLLTLKRGENEFPMERSFSVFRALTLYNLGHYSKSVEELLNQLVETTNDESILKYKKALNFYADKLDQTWSNE